MIGAYRSCADLSHNWWARNQKISNLCTQKPPLCICEKLSITQEDGRGEKINVYHCCTRDPNNTCNVLKTHVFQTIEISEHVFCEKPFAPSRCIPADLFVCSEMAALPFNWLTIWLFLGIIRRVNAVPGNSICLFLDETREGDGWSSQSESLNCWKLTLPPTCVAHAAGCQVTSLQYAAGTNRISETEHAASFAVRLPLSHKGGVEPGSEQLFAQCVDLMFVNQHLLIHNLQEIVGLWGHASKQLFGAVWGLDVKHYGTHKNHLTQGRRRDAFWRMCQRLLCHYTWCWFQHGIHECARVVMA